MATLGQKPATQHVSFQKQTITGNGGTSYTLQQNVGSELDIAVFVNNTRQEPTTAYTASGTTLSMTGAVNSSDHFYVIFLAKAINTTGLPVSAVNTENIIGGAVTGAKIANSTIDLTSKITGILPAANGGTAGTGGGGKILQAVGALQETNSYASSTSAWTGTGMSVAITPSSTSSKILLMVTANGYQDTAGQYYMMNVHRHSSAIAAEGSTSGATRLFDDTRGFGIIYGNSGDRFAVVAINHLDSPNTTSEIYYNCTHKKGGGSPNFNHSTPTSSMVVLEVSA